MTDWQELTDRTLRELREAPELYRPTNFWGPGLDALLADMRDHGLENFKSWPTARIWFHPVYGEAGRPAAARDFDVARAMWDQDNWPFDFTLKAEARLGNPPEIHRLDRHHPRHGYGRAYLNYLLMMAALSRHVRKPPRSFLEIGGGFGVLAEVLLPRDHEARYVDLDIPPLCTVASYYLSERFPRRTSLYTGRLAEPGPLSVGTTGVLPNYRLPDLTDEFEVFVNSYSFQEMEPDVVEEYVEQVSRRGIRWAVSLNSREGKPKAEQEGAWGALDPVTSDLIVSLFEKRGFTLVGSYDDPLVRSAGRVVVLHRR